MANNLEGQKGRQFNKENAAAYGKTGGINSGISRRNKKALKDVIMQIMTTPVKANKKGGKKFDNIKSLDEIKDCDLDVQTAIVAAQVKKALQGDVVAATFLRDTMGENPVLVAKVESNVKAETTIVKPIEKLAYDLFDNDNEEVDDE